MSKMLDKLKEYEAGGGRRPPMIKVIRHIEDLEQQLDVAVTENLQLREDMSKRSIDDAKPEQWDFAAAKAMLDKQQLESAIISAEATADNTGKPVYIIDAGGVYGIRTAERYRDLALEIVNPPEKNNAEKSS